MLPTGDHTPIDYTLPLVGAGEFLKRPIRRFFYPFYNALNHFRLARKYATADFQPDLWLWGQRGNDYERHRRRVGGLLSPGRKDVLVAGCGTGRDVESWLSLAPCRVVGVDWFSYERAWTLWMSKLQQVAPATELRFEQADLSRMQGFADGSFDLVGSDAVFEHVRNLSSVLDEFHRVLRPGGLLYATFGPLWFGWGGDHVSGYDGVTSGYSHLLLDSASYHRYLDGMGEHSHSEHDGRTWIQHDLFSRLGARQYLRYLEEAGFRRLFVSAIIDPRALACMQHPQFDAAQLERFDRLDLLISGMTIIYAR